jgi:hypothetical protein
MPKCSLNESYCSVPLSMVDESLITSPLPDLDQIGSSHLSCTTKCLPLFFKQPIVFIFYVLMFRYYLKNQKEVELEARTMLFPLFIQTALLRQIHCTFICSETIT